MAALIDELDAWLDEHWDPGLTVGEWWTRLAEGRWSAAQLPAAAGGRGLDDEQSRAVRERLAARSVLPPPGGTGMAIVLPTILEHGTSAQVAALVPDILSGRAAWCLLLSEPNAGSDLAALTTSATLDGDEWAIDGRKTWATGAHQADRALLLARSDPDTTRHRGLTALVLDLHQGGVEIRPMREMTGRALSNDVFIAGARLPADAVLGDVGGGWTVIQTTVTAERRSVGGAHGASARPGSVTGDLDRRAGDLVAPDRSPARREAAEPPARLARRVTAPTDDRVLRQQLMRLHTADEIAHWTAARAATSELPGAANIAKLWAGEIARRSAQLAMTATSPAAMLHGYRSGQRAALADALGPSAADGQAVTDLVLNAPAVSLVGGVDRLQRDLLGERVLGLPKSPAPDPA
ncbi:MAG: acyl-CoA dehydrogenase family protein [Ilumatobacteraceae bacterium]